MVNQPKISVASGHQATTEAALWAMREGGNAYDAFIAATLIQNISEPGLTSLAGGAMIQHCSASGELEIWDAFVDTPMASGQDEHERLPYQQVTLEFSGSSQSFFVGPRTVAVPGVLKALQEMHQQYARLPWDTLIQPALAVATNGLSITKEQAYSFKLLYPIISQTEYGRAFYCGDGVPKKEGELFKNPHYADWLPHSEQFIQQLYQTGRRITIDVDHHSSADTPLQLFRHDELARYRVIKQKPLHLKFGEHDIYTSATPSFGGRLLADMLFRFEQQATHKTRDEQFLFEEMFISAMEQALQSITLYKSLPPQHSRGTTHITISDAEGNIVAGTSTSGEGSGFFLEDTGIMMNNMLGEDDLFVFFEDNGFPIFENGIRLGTGMSPTLVFDAAKTCQLAMGSGGSKRITTAVAQVLIHHLFAKLDLKSAIHHPRIHLQDGIIHLEPRSKDNSIDLVIPELKSQGYEMNFWDQQDLYFGGVHSIIPGRAACGDARRGGHAFCGTTADIQLDVLDRLK